MITALETLLVFIDVLTIFFDIFLTVLTLMPNTCLLVHQNRCGRAVGLKPQVQEQLL